MKSETNNTVVEPVTSHLINLVSDTADRFTKITDICVIEIRAMVEALGMDEALSETLERAEPLKEFNKAMRVWKAERMKLFIAELSANERAMAKLHILPFERNKKGKRTQNFGGCFRMTDESSGDDVAYSARYSDTFNAINAPFIAWYKRDPKAALEALHGERAYLEIQDEKDFQLELKGENGSGRRENAGGGSEEPKHGKSETRSEVPEELKADFEAFSDALDSVKNLMRSCAIINEDIDIPAYTETVQGFMESIAKQEGIIDSYDDSLSLNCEVEDDAAAS